jgi:hypothetical protein
MTMRKSTLAVLFVGLLAVGALGYWFGPSVIDRDTEATAPAAAASPSVEPATPPPAPVRRTTAKKASAPATIAPDVVPSLPATQAELHERLEPVLNRGTRMELAAAGFRDAEQFAAVAHAARNTGVPFAVLKHRVLEEGRTLARAIRESKPEIDAEREAARARNAARFDIAVITG